MVDGTVAPGWEPLRTAFEHNFKHGFERCGESAKHPRIPREEESLSGAFGFALNAPKANTKPDGLIGVAVSPAFDRQCRQVRKRISLFQGALLTALIARCVPIVGKSSN